MSNYLVERIAGLPNVELVTRAEIIGLDGNEGQLEAVRWRRRGTDEEVRRHIRHHDRRVLRDVGGNGRRARTLPGIHRKS